MKIRPIDVLILALFIAAVAVAALVEPGPAVFGPKELNAARQH